MSTLQAAMATFKQQLKDGDLIDAYQGLVSYFRELRSYFERRFPDYSVPSNIYFGYLDMTYFAVIPPAFKPRRLKIAIVFDYEHFRFEVWLSGSNRKVQAEVWNQIKDKTPGTYSLADNPKAVDYILSGTLVEEPDFSDLSSLTAVIESGTLDFIRAVEELFSMENN